MRQLKMLSIAVTAAILTPGCSSMITMDQEAKTAVQDCKIKVIDVRTDRQIIMPAPGTTYSFPTEVPMETALLNKACHTPLKTQPITLVLETATCQARGGFSTPEFALKVAVQGRSTPYVAIKGEDKTSFIGDHCGQNMMLAIDAVLTAIQQ